MKKPYLCTVKQSSMNQHITYSTTPLHTFFADIYSFSAKEKDSETGLSYFGSRYYSSDLSIWLSVDPMSDKYPSLSPYAYCANNPVKLVDSDGEEIEVTANDNGSYMVVGGTLNKDRSIYIIKDGKRTGEVLGLTMTEYSFLMKKAKWLKVYSPFKALSGRETVPAAPPPFRRTPHRPWPWQTTTMRRNLKHYPQLFRVNPLTGIRPLHRTPSATDIHPLTGITCCSELRGANPPTPANSQQPTAKSQQPFTLPPSAPSPWRRAVAGRRVRSLRHAASIASGLRAPACTCG